LIQGLDHIGIAVASLDDGLDQYVKILGFTHIHTEEIPSEKVRVAILRTGTTRVELLEPSSKESPIAKFLQKKGPGIHHLAFHVDSIETEVKKLREHGVTLIDPAPRPGTEGSKVAFIHPKSAGGTLIELVERPAKTKT